MRHPLIAQRLVHLVTIGALITLAAPYAEAKPKKSTSGPNLKDLSKEERELFDILVKKGRVAFEEARYDDAATALEQAYIVLPLPSLLFRIAQCYERLDDGKRAIAAYERFLKVSPDYEGREELDATLATMRASLPATLIITSSPAEARVIIREQLVGLTPYTHTTREREFTLRVETRGYLPQQTRLRLTADETRELNYTLEPEVAAPLTGAKNPRRTAGIALLSGGGALLVGSAALATLSISQQRALNTIDRAEPRPDDYDARFTRSARYGTGAIAAGTLGALSLGLGAWLFPQQPPSSSEDAPGPPEAWLTPSLSPTGATLTLQLSY